MNPPVTVVIPTFRRPDGLALAVDSVFKQTGCPDFDLLIVDNDPTRSTFGRWFQRGYPEVDPDAVERFWSRHGWTRTPVDMGWRFQSRADLEAVVRIEFTAPVAEAVLAEHEGVEVDYAVNLWSRTY